MKFGDYMNEKYKFGLGYTDTGYEARLKNGKVIGQVTAKGVKHAHRQIYDKLNKKQRDQWLKDGAIIKQQKPGPGK